MNSDTATTIDLLSITTLIATLLGMLPAIAALLTCVWTALRIYESITVQKYLRKKK